MLCGVVLFVEAPEEVDVVHQTVVPVEPKVENGRVEEEVDGHPGQVGEVEKLRLIAGVDDRKGKDGSQQHHTCELVGDVRCFIVGDAVTRMSAIKGAVPFSHAAEKAEELTTVPQEVTQVERTSDGSRYLDASVVDKGVMHQQRRKGSWGDPSMLTPDGADGHRSIHGEDGWSFGPSGVLQDVKRIEHTLLPGPLFLWFQVPSGIGEFVA